MKKLLSLDFFSTETPRSFLRITILITHMHLITNNESKMGHLDEVEIENMKLYLPKG